MEITFPTDQGYAGAFVIGQRERGGQAARTGTIVLKRTYDVDRFTETLTPAAAPLPVFTQDRPYNLVVNGDFEAPQPNPGDPPDLTRAERWTPDGGTFLRALQGIDFLNPPGPSMAASLRGPGATLTQTIAFDEPLGGRTFTLSVFAKTNLPNAQVQVRLVEPDGAQICVIDAVLTITMRRFSRTGTWPAGVTASEARLVLRAPANPLRVAFYDRVQLEERATSTQWDPETELRQESDLAAYKPEVDLIVLGLTDVAGTASVSVAGATWLQRSVTAPAGGFDKALFGWQSRVTDGPRKQAVGTLPPPGIPAPPALLPNFDNAFYNGFRRDAAQAAAQPFTVASPTAGIQIDRAATAAAPDYRLFLRGDESAAVLHFHGGGDPDDAMHWLREPVPMTLDTIVVEPEIDRCSLVWRGFWYVDDIPETAYRRLTVTASP